LTTKDTGLVELGCGEVFVIQVEFSSRGSASNHIYNKKPITRFNVLSLEADVSAEKKKKKRTSFYSVITINHLHSLLDPHW